MTDPNAERVGRTLNSKWTLTSLLGVGGAGAVYAAKHRHNGRTVAVKILHPAHTGNQALVTRFVREGYIANRVGHSGVVAVIDDDRTEDGLVYLVMELLEGESLEDRLARRGSSLPLPEALGVTAALLDVLTAAHERGIVHRDIKPENVFLLPDGRVKVLDFGIAKLHGDVLEQGGASSPTLTGSVFGTPGYMPPEQARGRHMLVDARSDVWAVGATLFVMLSGQRLHEAATTSEALLRAMTERVPPVRETMPWLPPAVAAVLDRALSFERAARWADARQMLAAMREAAGQATGRGRPFLRASFVRRIAAVAFAVTAAALFLRLAPRSGAVTASTRPGPTASVSSRPPSMSSQSSAVPVVTAVLASSTALQRGPPAQETRAPPVAASVRHRDLREEALRSRL